MEPRIPFHATDDHPLAGRLFYPPAEAAPPRAAVIIHGATAVPQGFYARFARHLAATLEVVVFTYDYRGVGESRSVDSLRGMQADMRDWGERDFTGAMNTVRARFPELPLLAVCHSFGGHALAMSDAAHLLSGAVGFGVQLPWVGHWPPLGRLRLELLWRVVTPAILAVFGYAPGWLGIGEDLPAGVMRQWGRWCMTPGYFLAEHPEYGERLASLRFPLRAYGAADDTYAPQLGVRAFADHIPGAEVTILDPAAVGRPIGHFAAFRPALSAPLWERFSADLDGFLDTPRLRAGEG